MECTNSQLALLSDFEVHELLGAKYEAAKARYAAAGPRASKNARKPKMETAIEREVRQYLLRTNGRVALWTSDQVTAFMQGIQRFSLLKGEKLMLLNTRPHNHVCLHTCIEEADERFSAADQDAILEVLNSTLPLPSEAEDEEGMEVE